MIRPVLNWVLIVVLLVFVVFSFLVLIVVLLVFVVPYTAMRSEPETFDVLS